MAQLETLQIRLPKAIIKRLDSDAKQDMYATSRSELIRHILIRYYVNKPREILRVKL